MKKSWKIPVIAVCVVAVAGIGGYFGITTLTKSSNKTAQSYMKVKAIKGSIAVTVSASGTAASGLSKDIIAQNSATLGSFSVKTGDTVKSGQSLGTLQDQNSDQNLLKAKNALAQDNLKLSQLKASLNALTVKAPVAGTVIEVNGSAGDDAGSIAKTLGKQSLIAIQYTDATGKTTVASINGNGTIASVNVSVGTAVNKGDVLFQLKADDINNSISSQQINIQQDQDNLTSAQKQVDFNNMLSPIDGTVAALNFNPGDTIQAGKTIATVIDLTQMQTVVAVDELDIDKVKVGQKANITVDALTGKTFTGQVLKISSLGKTTNSVTTYDVTVSIDKADGVKTGMTTNVTIAVESKDNVIMLPIEAVQGTWKYENDNSNKTQVLQAVPLVLFQQLLMKKQVVQEMQIQLETIIIMEIHQVVGVEELVIFQEMLLVLMVLLLSLQVLM